MSQSYRRHVTIVGLLSLLVAAPGRAQTTTTPPESRAAPTTAPAPPPPSPVSGIRNKISAGDLLSAESILEVHREKHGDDGPALVGAGWLARGALLLGETGKARLLAQDVRRRCAARIAAGATPASDAELTLALGHALEVQAQLIAVDAGREASVRFLERELAAVAAPVSLRSRLMKRMNLMELPGTPAPELVLEEQLGGSPVSAGTLAGQPTLLFLFAEWCGDCKAMAPVLSRIQKRHADRGLRVYALSRYYDDAPRRLTEKARVDSSWKAVYPELATVPVLMSTASMERYGGSSTPTFVFVDRDGIVRDYTPTRLTEAELERRLAAILE